RRFLDRVRRADAGADRVLAVHADLRRRLHRLAPPDRLQVDHGAAAVRVALLAGLHARLAADAAGIVDEEPRLAHTTPPASGARRAIESSGGETFVTRTAQILYSGIWETGSMARVVQLLAARSSGQW